MSDLEDFLAELKSERKQLDFMIERIEKRLAKRNQPLKQSKPSRHKRHSIPGLSENILEARPDGLSLQALCAELEKQGYKSTSKNFKNNVNSVLHKKGHPFQRLPDGRWIHEKFLTANKPEGANGAKETPVH